MFYLTKTIVPNTIVYDSGFQTNNQAGAAMIKSIELYQ